MPGPRWADLDQCLPPTAKVQQRGRSQSESLLFTLSNRGSSSTIQDRRGKPSAVLDFIEFLCIFAFYSLTLTKVVLLLSTRHLTYFVYNSQMY